MSFEADVIYALRGESVVVDLERRALCAFVMAVNARGRIHVGSLYQPKNRSEDDI